MDTVRKEGQYRFICHEHEDDNRGAWYSKPKPTKREIQKHAKAHVERYHANEQIVSIDIEKFTRFGVQLVSGIRFENDYV